MATKTKGQLEKSCEYLRWDHLAYAVLTVFRENQQSEHATGIKASADVWATNSFRRKCLFDRVKDHWVKRTGLDETYFPYSEDGVARMYFRFRKRNEEEISAFAGEIPEV